MDFKQSYTDTKLELQIMLLREFELRKRWEAAHKYMSEGKMPSSIYCHIGLDKGLDLYDKAAEELGKVVDECQRLEAIINQMESYMNQFSGLSNVIQCKRAQGYTLRQIAAETGYSESHIRNTISKSYNRSTHSTKVSC